MNPAIICDLDGTLCNITHRRPLVECDKPDWKSFNHPWQIKRDTLNVWCSELIKSISLSGYKIIFVTGRDGTIEKKHATYSWLRKYFSHQWLELNTVIHFREAHDNRKDYIIKEEIYNNYIKKEYEILFVVDDRKQVVDMWRRIGLTVLQCAEGDF